MAPLNVKPTYRRFAVTMLIAVQVTARTPDEAIEIATNSKHVWDDWYLVNTPAVPEATEVI